MLLRSFLESSPSMQIIRTLWRCRTSVHNLSWLHTVGVVMVLILSRAWTVQGMTVSEPGGFTQDCSGLAQDALLKQFWSPAEPRVAQQSTVLAAMVPRLSLHGRALATYETRRGAQSASTLETVFGLSQGAQREIIETPFSQEARAVILHPQILATVAHVLTPDVVEVHVAQQTSVRTVPLRVLNTTMAARTTPEEQGVQAQMAHLNTPYDLALVQTDAHPGMQPLPYPAVLSYGTGDPNQPTGGLQAGDCVAAIVTLRNDSIHDTGQDRLVVGKVLAKVPVATNSLTQTKLNVNMFTTDLPVQPGDSGSPVLALASDKPVLVGLVSATMYPTAAFTYVTRIDPVLALADALRLAVTTQQSKPLLVHSPESPRLEQR